MNTRSTWTLVMIALGMFAFIFFFERHHRTVLPPAGPLLPDLNLSAVTAVQVRPGDKDFILAERTNGVWQLTHPQVYPAELQRVRGLLQTLSLLTRDRQITSEELRSHTNAMLEFGFDTPQFSLFIKQGELEHRLFIGSVTRTGDEVFVRVLPSTEIFVADASILKVMPRSADEWRDRALLALDEKSVNRLTVTNNGRNWMEFFRDPSNATWRMIQPIPGAPPGVRAESGRIDKLIAELLALRVTRFPDVPDSDLASIGLRPPVFDVVLGQGTNARVALAFGGSPTNDSSQIYVRRRDPPGVVLVPKPATEYWTAHYEQFRDHRLITFAEGALDRIEFKGEAGFTLERQTNQTWQITAPIKASADLMFVRTFCGLMNNLRIQKFFNNTNATEYGLAPPERTYVFSTVDTNVAGGRRIVAQLEFGALTGDREQVYVRRTDEPFIYSIARSEDDLVRRAGQWWWLRDRAIWSFNTNDVIKVTVRHAGKVTEVIREPTGGWALGPGSTGSPKDFNKLAIEYALDSLGHLKLSNNDFWMDHGPDAPLRFGITDQSIGLEVELRGEPTAKKLKMSVQAMPAGIFSAAELDGQVYVFPFPPWVLIQVRQYLDPAPDQP